MADTNAGTDKPNARRAGWTVVARRVTWEGQRFRIYQDEVTPPGQDQPRTYAYMESAPAVIIVPVTATGEVVLIRQLRYACDVEVAEVPARTRGDQEDASLEQVTRRREVAGQRFSAQPFPPFLQELIHAGGLVAWVCGALARRQTA